MLHAYGKKKSNTIIFCLSDKRLRPSELKRLISEICELDDVKQCTYNRKSRYLDIVHDRFANEAILIVSIERITSELDTDARDKPRPRL